MEYFIIGIAVGTLIPGLAHILKKVVEYVTKNTEKQIIIKDNTGREKIFNVNLNANIDLIRKLYENEIDFEENVSKALINYRNRNKNFKFYEGKNVDFIGEYGDKKIAIEAKANIKKLNKKTIERYIEDNSNVKELILVLNTTIPKEILDEVKNVEKDIIIKFVSSPKGRRLNETLSNLLDNEFKIKNA